MNYSKSDLIKYSKIHISNYIDMFHYDAINTDGLTPKEAAQFLRSSKKQIKKRLLETELPPACADFCQANDGALSGLINGFSFSAVVNKEINKY